MSSDQEGTLRRGQYAQDLNYFLIALCAMAITTTCVLLVANTGMSPIVARGTRVLPFGLQSADMLAKLAGAYTSGGRVVVSSVEADGQFTEIALPSGNGDAKVRPIRPDIQQEAQRDAAALGGVAASQAVRDSFRPATGGSGRLAASLPPATSPIPTLTPVPTPTQIIISAGAAGSTPGATQMSDETPVETWTTGALSATPTLTPSTGHGAAVASTLSATPNAVGVVTNTPEATPTTPSTSTPTSTPRPPTPMPTMAATIAPADTPKPTPTSAPTWTPMTTPPTSTPTAVPTSTRAPTWTPAATPTVGPKATTTPMATTTATSAPTDTPVPTRGHRKPPKHGH